MLYRHHVSAATVAVIIAMGAGMAPAHADGDNNQGDGMTIINAPGNGHHLVAGDHHVVGTGHVTGAGHDSPVAGTDHNVVSPTAIVVCPDGTRAPNFCLDRSSEPEE